MGWTRAIRGNAVASRNPGETWMELERRPIPVQVFHARRRVSRRERFYMRTSIGTVMVIVPLAEVFAPMDRRACFWRWHPFMLRPFLEEHGKSTRDLGSISSQP
jgi:hypothetical protein